jgi:hypothetical protein
MSNPVKALMPSTLKVALSGDIKAFIDEVGEKQNLSGPDVVRKALAAYRYLENVREKDGMVTLKRADGDLEKLVGL